MSRTCVWPVTLEADNRPFMFVQAKREQGSKAMTEIDKKAAGLIFEILGSKYKSICAALKVEVSQ